MGEAEFVTLLQGDKVSLGLATPDLQPKFVQWYNDFETAIHQFRGDVRPGGMEDAQERYKGSMSETEVPFAIYERSTGRLVGATHLSDIDHYNRTARFGITIGEKDCRGKGYGTEATHLTLDWGFHGLGLHNILLTVFAYNGAGITAYRRAGFAEIGRRREAKRVAGQAFDVIYMDAIATEFAGSRLRGRLPQAKGS